MIAAFKPGTRVISVFGGRGTISYRLKSYGWRVPGYLGDGFYEVIDSTGKAWVSHEDDLRFDSSVTYLLLAIEKRSGDVEQYARLVRRRVVETLLTEGV